MEAGAKNPFQIGVGEDINVEDDNPFMKDFSSFVNNMFAKDV